MNAHPYVLEALPSMRPRVEKPIRYASHQRDWVIQYLDDLIQKRVINRVSGVPEYASAVVLVPEG